MIGRYIRALAALGLVCTMAATARQLPVGAAASAQIAYSQNGQVSLMHGDGMSRRSIGSGAVYAWSRDGNYLLLVRGADLLLLNPAGSVLHTLAANVSTVDFPPAWAIDGDMIIYETLSAPSTTEHSVFTVDLGGHATMAWRFYSTESCGGAAPFAPDALMNQEVGFDDIASTIQWSISRHLAVYPASCRGGLNVVDMRTGHIQPLDPVGTTWNEPALSPSGRLAVVAGDLRGTPSVVLTTPVPGARAVKVAPGELPLWSEDGHTLYFERITAGKPISYVGTGGKTYAVPTHLSAIWRAGADGSSPSRIYTQNAYGLGPLSLLGASGTLVFSSVDNATSASKQYLVAGGIVPPLGGHTRILRLDPNSGKASVVLVGAGRPVGQP